MNTGEHLTATAQKNGRLVLKPPKLERSWSMEKIQPTHLRLSQPKRERSVSVEETQAPQLRLRPPKRKNEEKSPVPIEAFRPSHRRLNQLGATKVRKDRDRVRSGRVSKTSAKARKSKKWPFFWACSIKSAARSTITSSIGTLVLHCFRQVM